MSDSDSLIPLLDDIIFHNSSRSTSDSSVSDLSTLELDPSGLDASNLSLQESLLNNSRITPTGNGDPDSKPYCTEPTSGQKWWAAVLLGLIFALISSPAAYYITSTVTTSLGGIPLMYGAGPNFAGLVIHTLIFIVIVRVILW
jgi:hypothetical protein